MAETILLGEAGTLHQALSKFAEHNIDMVSWVHRKCQTRAGVSGDVLKTLECVTKTESKFPKSSGMNNAKENIHKWVNNMTWTVRFCPNRCKWELPDKHIPNSILPHELLYNILIISTAPQLSSSFPSLVDYRPCDCFGRISIQYILFSLCCIQCHEAQRKCDIPPTVSEEQLLWVQVTPYHPYNSVNLPRHLPHSTLHLLLGGDGSVHLYIHYTTMVTTVPLAWSHLINGMSLVVSYPSVP